MHQEASGKADRQDMEGWLVPEGGFEEVCVCPYRRMPSSAYVCPYFILVLLLSILL